MGCDQASNRDEPAQSLLGGFLRLVFAENPGAFLSLGGRLPPAVRFGLLTVGVGLLLLLGLLYLLERPGRTPRRGWAGRHGLT